MRLALVGPTHPLRGGIAHYTSFLYQEMSRYHDTAVISFRRQYPKLLFPGRTDADPSVTGPRVPAEPMLDSLDPLSWIRTAARLRSLDADAVVMQWWVPYWAPAFGVIARLLGPRSHTRLLYVCHNILPHEHLAGSALMARFALSPAQGYIVHSSGDEASLRALLPRAQIERCALPTYQALQATSLPTQGEARQSLGLAADEPVLLFFGFVRPYKGLRALLRALPEVRRSLPVHLLIVGEFWESPQSYAGEIEALGLGRAVSIVNRYVPNEELGPYFAAADVAVLPYESATQSAVAQLAFGLGLPVIATDVGGLSEAIENGHNGLLVPPGDIPALAQAIVHYFSESLGPAFREGIAASRDKFAWRRLREAIERLASA
jgi:glycosyltransferase involved in cell wall biosynthesis